MIDYYIEDEPYQPPVERPIRTVQLERYEYLLYYRRGRYYVKCVDSGKKSLEHGPFTGEEANVMIESRIERHEETKR